MSNQPLCFVLMPFGSKPDPVGGPNIDFNRVYALAIKPGIEDADMFPIRADEEKLGGIIHKAMFERLLVCDFAVADLTTSNANVMYELGVRHAARPRTTLTIYAESTPLPFDVRLLRTQPYSLGAENEFPDSSAATLRSAVAEHLRQLTARAETEEVSDSPLFQLVAGWKPELLSRQAAESFQIEVRANEAVKERLRLIRSASEDLGQRAALSARLADITAETSVGGTVDAGVLTELMLAHRSLEEWSGMIEVCEAMPELLQRQAPIRQQVAFAYNRRAETTKRAEDRATALHILERLEQEQGSSSETSGLIGRIFKGKWLEADEAGDSTRARQFLIRAVKAYVRGFETDWRDVYPGVNAVTLLEVQGDEKALSLKKRLLPVVRFAAEQRLQAASPSYWDYATMLELAVLADDAEQAEEVLADVLSTYSETWQPQTTVGNLRIIERARVERGDRLAWTEPIMDALDAATGGRAGSVPAPGHRDGAHG